MVFDGCGEKGRKLLILREKKNVRILARSVTGENPPVKNNDLLRKILLIKDLQAQNFLARKPVF
jgi:hypothetical protein